MILLEHTKVYNFEGAIRGARNPMNSWAKSDSYYRADGEYILGPNDIDLGHRLAVAGPDHRKFLRQIFVSVDITAPFYWWKEADTYKVATVANSCSTMHKLASTHITMDMFSMDDCESEDVNSMFDLDQSRIMFQNYINYLESLRVKYNETKDKALWRRLIQMLPENFDQKRTWTCNYETLTNIYYARRAHKLSEWHTVCDWITTLPYAKEFICCHEPESDK